MILISFFVIAVIQRREKGPEVLQNNNKNLYIYILIYLYTYTYITSAEGLHTLKLKAAFLPNKGTH